MASTQAVTGSSGKPESTWGDTVRVSQDAPIELRPGTLAEVVGIREVNTQTEADQLAAPFGTRLYLVEFGDGEAVEVPERWIEVAP